jgi:hypothetical protein
MSVQNLNAFGMSIRREFPYLRYHSRLLPLYFTLDPFADEADPLASNQDVGTQNYIHIRVQQRNGRKTLTTLQGLPRGTRLAPI